MVTLALPLNYKIDLLLRKRDPVQSHFCLFVGWWVDSNWPEESPSTTVTVQLSKDVFLSFSEEPHKGFPKKRHTHLFDVLFWEALFRLQMEFRGKQG